jgi:hypothetical protein
MDQLCQMAPLGVGALKVIQNVIFRLFVAFIIEQLKVLQSISTNPSLSSCIKRWELPLHDGSGFIELAAREYLKFRLGQSK